MHQDQLVDVECHLVEEELHHEVVVVSKSDQLMHRVMPISVKVRLLLSPLHISVETNNTPHNMTN